jgi:3-phenylpropionate/cinnamic acid dioxygenase small subunit
MKMADDLLRRVADELDIRNVIYRMAMLADDGDLNEYASLFSEDAVWEMRGRPQGAADIPPIRGRANLLAGAKKRRADGVQGPGTHKYHCLLTTTVTLKGDKADAKSYFAYYQNVNTKPEIAVFAIYNDELVRTKDGWKVAARHIDPA